MTFLESIIHALNATMDIPPSFGIFHFAFMLLFIASTVLICIKFKDAKDSTMRRIALISWIIMLVLEVYKQFVLSFKLDGATPTWDYQWYAFPFQLCSTPLYVLPFIAFMKESKFRDALMSFMSTFSFFGGLVVFIYPNDVFATLIGINIQTMIHHGLQLLLGVYFFVYNRKKANIKYHLSAIPVFVVLAGIAVILNEVVYSAIISNGWNDAFNMFYISAYYPNHLPILSTVYELVHPILFIIIYVIGFALVGTLIYGIMKGLKKVGATLTNRHRHA